MITHEYSKLNPDQFSLAFSKQATDQSEIVQTTIYPGITVVNLQSAVRGSHGITRRVGNSQSAANIAAIIVCIQNKVSAIIIFCLRQ